MLLKDKVVLVTGSSAGIGAAIARHCVAEGARVMIHGHDAEEVQAMKKELGDAASAYCCDFFKTGVKNVLVQKTVDAFGRIDVLINNAGIYPRNDIDDLSEDLFDRVMMVNLKVPMFLVQAAVPHFRKQGGGVVVNIGSINAYCGQTDILVYSASKAGLMAMTRNLGDALGPDHIRVNQLNVGWTVTDNEHFLKISEGFPEGWESHIPRTYAPSGRLLRPDDIAKHAVFWASEQSAPVSGQVYELEQYPVIGRNLINQLDVENIKEKK